MAGFVPQGPPGSHVSQDLCHVEHPARPVMRCRLSRRAPGFIKDLCRL